jgi:hypothetical protein
MAMESKAEFKARAQKEGVWQQYIERRTYLREEEEMTPVQARRQAQSEFPPKDDFDIFDEVQPEQEPEEDPEPAGETIGTYPAVIKSADKMAAQVSAARMSAIELELKTREFIRNVEPSRIAPIGETLTWVTNNILTQLDEMDPKTVPSRGAVALWKKAQSQSGARDIWEMYKSYCRTLTKKDDEGFMDKGESFTEFVAEIRASISANSPSEADGPPIISNLKEKIEKGLGAPV